MNEWNKIIYFLTIEKSGKWNNIVVDVQTKWPTDDERNEHNKTIGKFIFIQFQTN